MGRCAYVCVRKRERGGGRGRRGRRRRRIYEGGVQEVHACIHTYINVYIDTYTHLHEHIHLQVHEQAAESEGNEGPARRPSGRQTQACLTPPRQKRRPVKTISDWEHGLAQIARLTPILSKKV